MSSRQVLDFGGYTEYRWEGKEASHSVGYVLPVVQKWMRGTPAGAVVLDAGCGNGGAIGGLKRHGWELHGLEISQSGLQQACLTHPDVDFERADLTKDLSGHRLWGRSDAVVSLEVVEHVFQPRAFARNCHGFLKPGGRLIVSTPYHGYLKNVVMALGGKMDGHFTALWDYGHIKFWSRKTLGTLLEEAGFRVAGFDGAGRLPYLSKSMVMVAEKAT